MNINILLCDDQKLFIDGVIATLNTDPIYKMIDYSLNEEELKNKIGLHKIDVIVLDLQLAHTDGFELIQWIHKNYPEIKILILTIDESIASIRNALQAGAIGYLTKNTSSAELLIAIKTIYNGISYLPNHLMQKLITYSETSSLNSALLTSLTERELEVLKLIIQEHNNSEIAKQLYLSVHTINSHRKSIFKKLNVKNVVSLIKLTINEKSLNNTD